MEAIESSEVSKSLLAEMTTWGVDDWLFIVNIEIMLIMAMLLRIYAWILVAILLHFVLMIVTKLVPNLLVVYAKYLRQAPRYCAQFMPIQKRGFRPARFGKGVQL